MFVQPQAGRVALVVLAISLAACAQDRGAREIELLSHGNPTTDRDQAERAFLVAHQVEHGSGLLGRWVLADTSEIHHFESQRDSLLATLAEAAGGPEPVRGEDGELNAHGAEAFASNGQFRGNRTLFSMRCQQVGYAADGVWAEYDRGAGMWSMMIAAPLVLGVCLLGLLVVGRLLRKKKPLAASRA